MWQCTIHHTHVLLARTEPFFMRQHFAHLRPTDFDFAILTSYPVIKPLQEVTHVFPPTVMESSTNKLISDRNCYRIFLAENRRDSVMKGWVREGLITGRGRELDATNRNGSEANSRRRVTAEMDYCQHYCGSISTIWSACHSPRTKTHFNPDSITRKSIQSML